MSGQPFRARFGFDADNKKLTDLADPTNPQDGVNLRTLKREAGIHFAARVGNLPSPNDPDPDKRPVDGRAYLIKYQLDGRPLDRIAIWDASNPATGGIAALHVVEPAADAAAITAAAGTSDPGNAFTGGAGTAGVFDLLANADGTITATVTTPGTGYAIGDTMTVPAASLAWAGMTGDTTITVTALAGASPTGGWRFVDPEIFLKQLRTDPDPSPGAMPGDLEVTAENGHEGLRVWTGSAWHTVLDADTIKGWISSLALFQGTVQENGGTVIGAISFAGLPDITNAATGVQHASQYWVWVGTAGYVVKTGDPNGVGADLTGAVLQVGDWLQVSSSTTGGVTTYHWAHIGGDLITKSRSDQLYGLTPWAAGSYEVGTLVQHQGKLYRASGAVTATDGAPGSVGAPWTVVPLNAGVVNVPTDADRPATAPPGDVYLVLNSAIGGGRPTLFSYDTAAAAWIQLGGASGQGMDLTGGDLMVNVGVPIGSIQAWMFPTAPAGWLICDGRTIDPTLYPELAALMQASYGVNTLPDLRGEFLRGISGTRLLNTREDYATALPHTPFVTAVDGTHHHELPFNLWRSSAGGGSGTEFPHPVASGGTVTRTDGSHWHTVNTGGDSETRPQNFGVNWIMKATDNAVRTRAITWTP